MDMNVHVNEMSMLHVHFLKLPPILKMTSSYCTVSSLVCLYVPFGHSFRRVKVFVRV